MLETSNVKDKRNFAQIRNQLVTMIAGSFIAVSVAGYSAAVFFAMPPHTFSALPALAIVAFVLTLFMALSGLHFWRWSNASVRGGAAYSYSCNFWGLHALYVFIAPCLFYLTGVFDFSGNTGVPLLSLILLQLITSILLCLPFYFMGLNILGRMASIYGLPKIQVSLRYRLFILVGLLPLLVSAILVEYYWWRTEYFTNEVLFIWGGLGIITLWLALVAIRGVGLALEPVSAILTSTETDEHLDFHQLRPNSTDEIGYLTQLLQKLFHRLKDREAQVRAIVDHAAEGIIVVDQTGQINTFNRAAEQLFGYKFSEIKGQPLSGLLPTIVVPGVMGICEIEGVDHSGQTLMLSLRITEMNISGCTMYTYLVADVSERITAQRKTQEAESRYRQLVETAHDLVWSMDEQARWTYLNAAAYTIYGYRPEEMIGQYARNYQSSEYAEQDLAAFKEALKGNDLVQYETVYIDKTGHTHYLSFNAKAFKNAEGQVVGISGTARDITEQKEFERQLAYQAQHDGLTGLANRVQFQNELERVVARVARSGATCALFYIDMDQFKYINDTLGHAAGDRLLIEFAMQLKSNLRDGDLLARFGGDEFTVLLYNVDSESAMIVAEHLRSVITDYRFLESGKAYRLSCSIGVALIDNATITTDECMAHADLACHLAKKQGRNRCYLYQPKDQNEAKLEAGLGWAIRLREALDQDRFKLAYQPILSIADGSVTHYEVLLRMVAEDGEIILPGGFLSAAERFGLMNEIDRWMVRNAMIRLAELQDHGKAIGFSLNISAHAFDDETLLPMIRTLLEKTNLDPSALTFEVSEANAIGNLPSAARFINELREIGCMFALDCFGSGFSSFTYLKHLPVDKLKIDGTFIQNMMHTTVDRAMVQSMTQVAHALDKIVIAGCVETAEALSLVTEIGVDYAQGYYVGEPDEHLLSQPTLHELLPPPSMLQ